MVTVLPERMECLEKDGRFEPPNLVLGQKCLIFALQLDWADVSFAPVLTAPGGIDE